MNLTTSPNRQTARSLLAQDNIAVAALAVFALKGYTAASMDDICLAAGCSKGGLYHHFPTKSAVLAAVVDRLARDGALLPPFQPLETSLAIQPGSIGRVLIDVWAEAARNDELRERLRAAYEACLDRRLQDETGDALADILRIGALVQALTRRDDVDTEAAARRLGVKHAA